MAWAAVCVNVRTRKKEVWETTRQKNKKCSLRKITKRQNNGQLLLFRVFIQKPERLQHQGIVDCQGFKNWWFHLKEKKKKQRWGKCNYPARSVREFYCLIIIPQRHVKLFLSYLFKTPRRHRSGEEVTRLQQGTRREKDVREMCRRVEIR